MEIRSITGNKEKIQRDNKIAMYSLVFIIGLLIGSIISFAFLRLKVEEQKNTYEGLILRLCELNNLHDEFTQEIIISLPEDINYTSTYLNCAELLEK